MQRIAPQAIVWDTEPRKINADPVALLNLDRSDWQALGAVFHRRSDNDGEMPWLATGCLYTHIVPIEVGVLDYDDDSTYLLVPGDAKEKQYNLLDVFKILSNSNALDLDNDVLSSIPFEDEEIQIKALLNNPDFLADIDAAEKQIADGTMISLEYLAL